MMPHGHTSAYKHGLLKFFYWYMWDSIGTYLGRYNSICLRHNIGRAFFFPLSFSLDDKNERASKQASDMNGRSFSKNMIEWLHESVIYIYFSFLVRSRVSSGYLSLLITYFSKS